MYILTAKLVKLGVCPCGFPTLKEDTPLGKEYLVDVDSIRRGWMRCGGCHHTVLVHFVDVYDNLKLFNGTIVSDVLEIPERRKVSEPETRANRDTPVPKRNRKGRPPARASH